MSTQSFTSYTGTSSTRRNSSYIQQDDLMRFTEPNNLDTSYTRCEVSETYIPPNAVRMSTHTVKRSS